MRGGEVVVGVDGKVEMSEVEEGVPPEAGGASGGASNDGEASDSQAGELPARLGAFHELCARLGITDIEEKLATEFQVSDEQQLMVLAELGLPEKDCQEIGINSTQRKSILEWATQEQRRKRDEILAATGTRRVTHTPEELAETEEIERKAREGRSLAASGFPWVDTHGEIQHKVTLWSYLYKEEAARVDPRSSALNSDQDSTSEPEPEPEKEPEPDSADGRESSNRQDRQDLGLRSWESPNNAAVDEALAAAEAKKLADDLEPSALDQAAALMAARSGRAAPTSAETTGRAEEASAPAALYGAPQEPAAAKEAGALDPDEAAAMEAAGADSTSPQADGLTSDDGTLHRAPSLVPSGRFGEGDWFCDARLRRCTSSKESWAEFRKLVPDKMKAVQPLIEAWLRKKAEAKIAAASKYSITHA